MNSLPLEFSGNFVRIEPLHFFGEYAKSPNGVYVLAWLDASADGSRGGARSSGPGTYMLLEASSLLVRESIPRPNEGAVANNGNFVLNDWGFGNAIGGMFFAGDRTGRRLVNHQFEANLGPAGIAPSGRWAVSQTLSSERDSDLLTLWDLVKCRVQWEQNRRVQWARSFTFDEHAGSVTLLSDDGGRWRYGLDGRFLDETALQSHLLATAYGFTLHRLVRERLAAVGEDLDAQAASEVVELLNLALRRGLDRYPRELAAVHRTLGEVLERLGEPDRALAAYQAALTLDPKAGLKKRVVFLEAAIRRGEV
jgi:hypothetical protein